jgi:hypothetical protein
MPTPFSGPGPIKVAVVTGRHAFDVPAFHALFRNFADVDPYIQHMEDWASDWGKVRDRYHVVVFFHMLKEAPTEKNHWTLRSLGPALEELGSRPQGIVVLHHAIVAHIEWPVWNELTGIPDRTITPHMDQQVHVEVTDPDHPITKGLGPWEQEDETYEMNSAEEADGNHVLLVTDHPQSMRTLAWTRQHREAPIFCLQLGHDGRAYANPSFAAVLHRGIRWCAGESL